LIPTNSSSNTKKYKEMNRRITINSGYNATALARPQSFITKSKQRLKQHTDTVYLKNGDEFEIELYNPTTDKLLAKIEVNGNSIGAGIILRPGERVFLERYLDEAKKFLFETYVVNGTNQEVQQAIANNGNVKVRWHKEVVSSTYHGTTLTVGTPYDQPYYTPRTYTTHNLGTSIPTHGTFTTTSAYFNNTSFTSGVDVNTFYNKPSEQESSVCMDSLDDYKGILRKSTSPIRHVETGRVEKGSDSDQKFKHDNSDFYSWVYVTDEWNIKPLSTKPVVREEIKTFCTECGAKKKKDTHKFCPHCGTKF
jgi:hypothetical protein